MSAYAYDTRPIPAPSDPNPPSLPPKRRFRRPSFLHFAALTSISLAAMALMVGLNPQMNLISRGNDAASSLRRSDNLIADCRLPYRGCHDANTLLDTLPLDTHTKNALNLIGLNYDINPQVLVTLDVVLSDTPDNYSLQSLDQTKLTEYARLLHQLVKDSNLHPIPVIMEHDVYGPTHLVDYGVGSYAIIQFISLKSPDVFIFNESLKYPISQDNSNHGFVEIFLSLFHTDPRLPIL